MTECNCSKVDFQHHGTRKVTGSFDASRISSDGGALLLRELEEKTGVIEQFSECFDDYRDQRYVEHSLSALLRQRIFCLNLGYEDLNDAEQLQTDPLLGLACGREDLSGEERRQSSDIGKPLASQSTLNRIELAVPKSLDDVESVPNGDNKITFNTEKACRVLIDLYVQAQQGTIPKRIILDLDNTDAHLHGNQEGRHYNAYYDNYCYTPLYIFTDDGDCLWSELQTCDESPTRNSVHAVRTIIERLRSLPGWEDVVFIVRGDSGFCRDDLMKWCEINSVFYILGVQKNTRLVAEIEALLDVAEEKVEETGEPAVFFHQFFYSTLDSWSQERLVSAKAEVLPPHPDTSKSIKRNPRFIVSNLPESICDDDPEYRYTHWYCPRGEMENRIKEHQLCLFSDRVSCSRFWSNHLRQWFSTMAYVLTLALRRLGLKGSKLAKAQGSTIRARLYKIGAFIRKTTRRIVISLSSSHPGEGCFIKCMEALRALKPFHL